MVMVEPSAKTRESRLRRMAERQGLALQKSRRRDPRASGYGTYQLVDVHRNTLVAGDPAAGYGLDLDDVERWLTSTDLTVGLVSAILAGVTPVVEAGRRLLLRSAV